MRRPEPGQPGRTVGEFIAAFLLLILGVAASAPAVAQPAVDWASRAGAASNFDYGSGVAVDLAGNVYNSGHFLGTVDFDPGPGVFDLTSINGIDGFVRKLDHSGNLLWAVAIGGSSNDWAYDLTLDPAGDVYVTGDFGLTVDFDPGPGVFNLTSAGSLDHFVLKLDTDGEFVWAASMGGSDVDTGRSVAVDADGNVFTTGYFSATADFDPGPGVSNLTSAGGSDIFVHKLNADGTFAWAAGMGSTTRDEGVEVAVDAAGNVYTTGSFEGTVDFDPGPGTLDLTSPGFADIFVQKLSGTGALAWAARMGGTSGAIGRGIGLDAAGNVYTAGNFVGTADFDPGPGTFNLTSPSDNDAFVSKLDSAGSFVWAVAFTGLQAVIAHDLAIDVDDNVLVTGDFRATPDFDPGAGTFNLTSQGLTDIFITKLDSAGAFVWAVSMGAPDLDIFTPHSDTGRAVAADSASNVFTTGTFKQTADFDPGPGTLELTSAGEFDIFLHKLGTAPLPANIAIVQAESVDPVVAGSGPANLVYTVSASNQGQQHATGLEVVETLTLPPGVLVHDATPSGVTTVDGTTSPITWTIGNLAAGAREDLIVELTVTTGAAAGSETIAATAAVSALDQTDPVAVNDSSTVATSVSNWDFGDAPDPAYPTLLASGGARHAQPSALFLGAGVDNEADGQPTASADGDDTDGQGDDDDGVSLTSGLRLNIGTTISDVVVTASTAGRLYGWVDFNADGDWDDFAEQVFDDESLAAGANPLTFGVPPSSELGPTFARFRVSGAAGLSYDGAAFDGEVEDYLVEVTPDDHLALFNMTVNEQRVYLACQSISAGGDFAGFPDLELLMQARVTLQAGDRLVLRNGVFIDRHAELTVLLGSVPGCP